MKSAPEQEALQWQVSVWDRISQLYLCEIDPRFTPVVEGVIRRAGLKPGEKSFPILERERLLSLLKRPLWLVPPEG